MQACKKANQTPATRKPSPSVDTRQASLSTGCHLPFISAMLIVTIKPYPNYLRDTQPVSIWWTKRLRRLLGFPKLCSRQQGPRRALSLSTPFPPEGDARLRARGERSLFTPADSDENRQRLGPGPVPQPRRGPHPALSTARGHVASQRPGSVPRPRPARGLGPGGRREGRARPRAGRSARPPARGAPLAPRTYLRRPRAARAARSQTTAGRASPTDRRSHLESLSRPSGCRDQPAAPGERRADLRGARPIPARGRPALEEPRSGLRRPPIGGA